MAGLSVAMEEGKEPPKESERVEEEAPSSNGSGNNDRRSDTWEKSVVVSEKN